MIISQGIKVQIFVPHKLCLPPDPKNDCVFEPFIFLHVHKRVVFVHFFSLDAMFDEHTPVMMLALDHSEHTFPLAVMRIVQIAEFIIDRGQYLCVIIVILEKLLQVILQLRLAPYLILIFYLCTIQLRRRILYQNLNR
jgi:hypothetical protein